MIHSFDALALLASIPSETSVLLYYSIIYDLYKQVVYNLRVLGHFAP